MTITIQTREDRLYIKKFEKIMKLSKHSIIKLIFIF